MFNPERPPEITASRWLNSTSKRTLKGEKGKVVFVAIVQMLCPGSKSHSLPQAMRLTRAFSDDQVAVFGLHMAFERFDEQSPEKVEAFLAENGITLPVALDKANGDDLPQTMKDYELQGTPAILLYDRQGRLRRHYLGGVDDLRIGAEIMALLIEDKNAPREMSVAIEKAMAAALLDPSSDHEHGDDCGCGHDHSHDHNHNHNHNHNHEHGHDHAHSGGLNEAVSPGGQQNAEPGHVHGPGCKH